MGPSGIRTISPVRRIRGTLAVPGDKSISHRLLMLGAIADGVTRIQGLSPGDDCASTRACLAALGVDIREAAGPDGAAVTSLIGCGERGFVAPSTLLDAGNSGTTARLLMGLLAGRPLGATLSGDASLRRRPMGRVVDPLVLMGASIETTGGRLPASIDGRALHGIEYALPIPSAQVKSAILLAGLHADGVTRVREPRPTRDHTEVALGQFGARIDRVGDSLTLRGRQPLMAVDARVPGDPSSAAFWAAAAAGLPGSAVTIEGVCLNPTRTGFLHVLERFGAAVAAERTDDGHGEPTGTLRVAHRGLASVRIGEDEVPGVIDELPVLAALAALGGGIVVRGAEELRVKESDRISALVAGLRGLGAEVDEYPDGFAVDGTRSLAGGTADAAGDHRLAMAFAVAALGARGPSVIRGADAVSVSYPGFFDTLEALAG